MKKESQNLITNSILHGIMNNNVCVSKWNKTVSPLCEVCNVNEDIKHLLYDCKIVKHFWERISMYLKFDVTWKIVVLGFYNEISEKTSFLNNFLSFISFTIYKYKMKCRIQKERMCEQDLRHKLKNTLFLQNVIITSIGRNKNDFYKNVGNFL